MVLLHFLFGRLSCLPAVHVYRARLKGGPRLRECCRQCQAEVVSNSSNKVHQTWGLPVSLALYNIARVARLSWLIIRLRMCQERLCKIVEKVTRYINKQFLGITEPQANLPSLPITKKGWSTMGLIYENRFSLIGSQN